MFSGQKRAGHDGIRSIVSESLLLPHQPSCPQPAERWYSKILLLIFGNAFSHRNSVVDGEEVFNLTAKAYLLQNVSGL